MPDNSLFAQVLGPVNRDDPYSLYARMRETPVVREDDGTYIVSTHAEIRGLLHDPRLSSEDAPKSKHARTGNPSGTLSSIRSRNPALPFLSIAVSGAKEYPFRG